MKIEKINDERLILCRLLFQELNKQFYMCALSEPKFEIVQLPPGINGQYVHNINCTHDHWEPGCIEIDEAFFEQAEFAPLLRALILHEAIHMVLDREETLLCLERIYASHGPRFYNECGRLSVFLNWPEPSPAYSGDGYEVNHWPLGQLRAVDRNFRQLYQRYITIRRQRVLESYNAGRDVSELKVLARGLWSKLPDDLVTDFELLIKMFEKQGVFLDLTEV